MSRVKLFRARWIVLVVCALGVFAIESLAWPLAPGRDAGTYVMYWEGMWTSHPVYPQLMLFRTPLAPLVYGPLLSLGGAALAEAAMGLLFALSIVLYTLAADAVAGVWAAAATAVLLLAYPPYGALFHQVSSDPIFAVTMAAFVFQATRLWQRPSLQRAVGAAVVLLLAVLARPAAEALLVLGPGLLLLPGRFRRRAAIAGVYLCASLALLAAYSGYNDLRYGDFTVSRLGVALVPLYRTFVVDRIVRPDNGPASRRLASAVQQDLLPYQPYAAYGIDVDTFFSSGSTRMYADLVGLSDRVWGWASDYRTLRDAGVEAVERHPRAYASGVLSTLRTEASLPYEWSAANPTGRGDAAPSLRAPTVVVNGRPLPEPTEGEPIPASRLWWLASTPHGTLWTDWSSPVRPILRSRVPGGTARIAALDRRVRQLMADLPDRSGSASVASWLNRTSREYPRPPFWAALGLIGCAIGRRRRVAPAAVTAGIAAVLVIGTALGEPAVVEYRLPLDPVFVLFAVVGAAAAAKPLAAAATSVRRRLASG